MYSFVSFAYRWQFILSLFQHEWKFCFHWIVPRLFLFIRFSSFLILNTHSNFSSWFSQFLLLIFQVYSTTTTTTIYSSQLSSSLPNDTNNICFTYSRITFAFVVELFPLFSGHKQGEKPHVMCENRSQDYLSCSSFERTAQWTIARLRTVPSLKRPE